MRLVSCFAAPAVLLAACGPDVTLATDPSGSGSTTASDTASADTDSPGNEGVGETTPSDATDTTGPGVLDTGESGVTVTTSGDTTSIDTSDTTTAPPTYCEVTDCDDADPCTADTCHESTETCEHTIAAGMSCDDADECTSADVCLPDGTCAGEASCPIEHCGVIDEDETWGPELVHLLTCSVTVEGPSEPVLTILDGTTVLVEPAFGFLVGTGSMPGRLDVQGGVEGVMITSASPAPLPGDWWGGRFGSGDTGSTLMGVTIEYAGTASSEGVAVRLSGAEVAITDSVIRDSGNHGIFAISDAVLEMSGTAVVDNAGDGIRFESGAHLGGVSPSFVNNVVTGNGGAALRVFANDVGHLDASSSYAGNGEAIEVSRRPTVSATWRHLDADYELFGNLRIESIEEDVTIEIEAGTRISGGGLFIDGFFSDGFEQLLVMGTAEEPVHFDGVNLTTFADDNSDNPPSEFNHAIIENGNGIQVYGGVTRIRDCEIRNNDVAVNGAAVSVNSYTDVQITNTVIEDNEGAGLFLYWPLTAPFTNNTVTGNTIPARVAGVVPESLDLSSSFTGNGEDVIEILSGAWASTTWPLLGVPYRVQGLATSWSPPLPVTLTIDPGVTVLFAEGAGLEFGGLLSTPNGTLPQLGGLQAIGTPTQPITFRSASPTPAPGDWQGLIFTPEALPSAMQYVSIQHAGDAPSAGAVVVQADGVTVSDCTISDTDGWAIYNDGATATLSGNTYFANSDGDVFP
ncbi:MAG: right-handed parallel beta-helix repeat-containing protein [Nannocystaceae bacterium]|nr:right-handed parallel beta-helix repeat-containing protein [Nannocystaceae bacterium]